MLKPDTTISKTDTIKTIRAYSKDLNSYLKDLHAEDEIGLY